METENTNNNNRQLTVDLLQTRKKKIEEKFHYKFAYISDDSTDFLAKKTLKDSDTVTYAFIDYMSNAIEAMHEI